VATAHHPLSLTRYSTALILPASYNRDHPRNNFQL
jgi:hypothetical protein